MLAKVKNASGRIGIFFNQFASQKNTILKITSKDIYFESKVKMNRLAVSLSARARQTNKGKVTGSIGYWLCITQTRTDKQQLCLVTFHMTIKVTENRFSRSRVLLCTTHTRAHTHTDGNPGSAESQLWQTIMGNRLHPVENC